MAEPTENWLEYCEEVGVETPMNASELAMSIVDNFHDWIDGDDWVEDSNIDYHGGVVTAQFASGAEFRVTVEEIG